MVVKTSQGYQVLSEKGKPLSRPDLIKEEAYARLNQIEYYKNKKKRGK